MKSNTILKLKLISLGKTEDAIGSNDFLTETYNLFNGCLENNIKYYECRQHLRILMGKHLNTEAFKTTTKYIIDNDVGVSRGEYEWGTQLFTDDILGVIEFVYKCIDYNIKTGDITEDKVNGYIKDMTLFRMDLTESDLEDMTQEQLKTLQDEAEIVSDRTLEDDDLKAYE